MDFIKKNYEKVILGIVLLGLVGVLVMMWFVIQSDQQQMKDLQTQIFKSSGAPLPELDLTPENNTVLRLKSPFNLDLDTTNKLFNPVEWQRMSDGTLKKRSALGANAATVTDITPLYLVISLDDVMTNDLGARYSIGIERQASPNPALRRKQHTYMSKGEKNNLFTLKDVQGPAENPSALVLRFAETGETVTISKDKEFRRIDGYQADIKYDPGKNIFNDRRVGTMISFGGEDYIIVAIDKDEVILSAQSNLKKYILRYAQ